MMLTIESIFLLGCGAFAAYLAYKFRQVVGQIESLRKELALSHEEKIALRADLKMTREALADCRREHGGDS
jgi:hypothetical protein